MSRNALYAIVGILVVAVAVLGYMTYQDRQPKDGMQINIGKDGFEVKAK